MKAGIGMAGESKNSNLARARDAKQDEFYTQLSDIEKELKHYKKHFKGKVVYCNCDDPRVSGFFHYFSYNFERLGLKKLITTCYKNKERDLFSANDTEHAIMLEYTGDKNNSGVPDPNEIGIVKLNGDGDFRSEESIDLLKQADIVVTNPPFSLFREFITQLYEYDKKFIVVGSKNAITYKEIFKLIKENRLWLGNGFSAGNAYFKIPTQKTFLQITLVQWVFQLPFWTNTILTSLKFWALRTATIIQVLRLKSMVLRMRKITQI